MPASDDLTQRDASKYPYFFRTGWSSSQPHHALGACEQGYKKVVTVAADYAFGYESAGGFQKAFEDCGARSSRKSGIKTYPNVSQFWTYGKDKFLAQPVYSRDFPPCKFCE